MKYIFIEYGINKCKPKQNAMCRLNDNPGLMFLIKRGYLNLKTSQLLVDSLYTCEKEVSIA